MTLPAPRPGTLEWLTDQAPDHVVLHTPDGALTRAGWELRAEALAAWLEEERGVVAGALLSASGRIGADWLTLSWAVAKLGAGLAGLPPGPVVPLDGALHVSRDDLAAANRPALHGAALASAGQDERAGDGPANRPALHGAALTSAGQDERAGDGPANRPAEHRETEEGAGRNGRAGLADGARHVDAPDLGADTGSAGSRRLSGGALPDSVTFSRLGRPVRRRFSAGGVGAIGVALADLVARIGAAPGTTLVASGPVCDPVVTFVANVVVVGGGTVVTADDPAGALALAAEHDAGLAAFAPADLDALARLPEAAREALDLTGLVAVVVGAAAFDRAAAEDLFGAVTDVHATADTGVVAVRGPGDPHHVLLDGVSARVTRQGLLEVRSPLAAGPGWVATGDRAALVGDTGLQLL